MARSLKVEIVGDASRLKKSFGDASSAGSRFGNAMKKAGKFAAIGLAGGVAAGVVVLKKSVDAAIEAEKAQGRLDQAFKSTGATAKEQAASMAAVNKVSQKAALDDEDLMDTLGRLSRVTGDVTKAQSGMAIAADLARARNLSLEAATKVVEKAYLGNVGALKRIGIEIPKVTAAQDALKASHDKATDAQIKAAKAADDTATRQSAIAALQKQYTGAAEAYGNSAAGAQERFQVAIENLQEEIGAKLLPTFTRLAAWATTQLPVAFAAISRAAEVVWPKVRKAAEDVLAWYQTNLLPTVRAVIAAMKAAWDRFGGDVLKVVRADLTALRGAINTALALIRGDWNTAWRNLLPTVRGTFAALVALMTLQARVVNAAGKAIGRAAVEGIGNGLAALRAMAAEKFNQMLAFIRSLPGRALAAGIAIGRALTDGVIQGIGDIGGRIYESAKGGILGGIDRLKKLARIHSPSGLMADEIGKPLAEGIGAGMAAGLAVLKDKIVGGVQGAISAAGGILHGSGPFEFTRHAVGEKLAKGVTEGMMAGLAVLKAQVAPALKAITDRMEAQVNAARSRMQSAFGGLADKLLRAFDAESGGHQTAAGAELDAIAARRQMEDLASAVRSAQSALDEAIKGGDATAIAEAQRALFRAQEDVQMVSLEAQRVTQEQAYTDAREAQREHLEARLAALSASFTKEGATVKNALKRINSIMKAFGITFAESGQLVGEQFVKGLQAAIGGAASSAAGVKAANAGQANPSQKGQAIVVQTFLDGKLVAENGRKHNATYLADNGPVVAV